MKKILVYIMAISLMTGCDYFNKAKDKNNDETTDESSSSTKFNEATAAGICSIKIPEYMSVAKDLNESAVLQYSNPKEEMYLIVIADSKDEMKAANVNYTLQSYFDFAAKNLEGSVTNYKLTAPKSKKIHGNDALIGEINGNFNQYEVMYKLGTIESSKRFYQILTWTMGENRTKYGNDMNIMIESLKEV